MKPEGQVRIPSGCAIAAVISKDGNRMTGRKIIDAMKPVPLTDKELQILGIFHAGA